MNATITTTTTASCTDPKALYRHFLHEIFVRGHLEKLDQFLVPTYVNHDARPGAPVGPDGVRQIVTEFRAAFPDLSMTVHDQVAEWDMVCSRVTTRGTHHGPLFGTAPTGRPVTMTALTMVRIVDGRIVESWVKNDTASLMHQLGADT
jgi:predicted ester cyclase